MSLKNRQISRNISYINHIRAKHTGKYRNTYRQISKHIGKYRNYTYDTYRDVSTDYRSVQYTVSPSQNLMFTPCVTGGDKPLYDLVNSMFVMYSNVTCHPSAQRTCENSVQLQAR